jgi:hypothetical protein
MTGALVGGTIAVFLDKPPWFFAFAMLIGSMVAFMKSKHLTAFWANLGKTIGSLGNKSEPVEQSRTD